MIFMMAFQGICRCRVCKLCRAHACKYQISRLHQQQRTSPQYFRTCGRPNSALVSLTAAFFLDALAQADVVHSEPGTTRVLESSVVGTSALYSCIESQPCRAGKREVFSDTHNVCVCARGGGGGGGGGGGALCCDVSRGFFVSRKCVFISTAK